MTVTPCSFGRPDMPDAGAPKGDQDAAGGVPCMFAREHLDKVSTQTRKERV